MRYAISRCCALNPSLIPAAETSGMSVTFLTLRDAVLPPRRGARERVSQIAGPRVASGTFRLSMAVLLETATRILPSRICRRPLPARPPQNAPSLNLATEESIYQINAFPHSMDPERPFQSHKASELICSKRRVGGESSMLQRVLASSRRLRPSQRRDLRPRAGRKAIGVRLASRSAGVSRGRRRTAGGTPFRARPGS